MASNKKINDTETRVKALQNNYVDLTKTGPLTYRELDRKSTRLNSSHTS